VAEQTVKTSFTIFSNASAVVKDSSSNLNYLFRYAIVNQEGTELSEWSSIKQVDQENVSNVLNGFSPTHTVSSVESGGQGINVRWTVPDSFVAKEFDIYYSWSYESSGTTFTDFKYADSVTSNSHYIDIPINGSSVKAKRVKVAVQLPTNIKIINENALLFASEVRSTLPLLDGGEIV
jgi:hypothetical protein